ncbi:hypothetical protein [Phenylobacterium sp.]|jgi:hypothetical protein|uniref:hypothetical protein n=1 Tax=Phenylobacterium sp. TaxID=1871053 RepID=UPI002EDA691E
MRARGPGIGVGAIGVVAAIGLLLAACQDKGDDEANRQAFPPKASPQRPALAPVTADSGRPGGADGVDAGLAKVKAFNERTPAALKAIADHEARIRSAAARALEAGRGADQAPAARRASLTALVTAARREAETAHAALMDGQAKLRQETDDQVTAAEAMLETCNASEPLLAYEGCKALEAEHALLLTNLQALAARYQAAEAAYGPDRAKLEEASAAVALAAMR